LTFLKSTLSSLPIYFLFLFPILVSVARQLEKIQWDFLWGGVGEVTKLHLVNWKTVCQPMSWGDLGIKDVVYVNKTLLGKWLWRLAT
jgi:hypothetical protein